MELAREKLLVTIRAEIARKISEEIERRIALIAKDVRTHVLTGTMNYIRVECVVSV